MKGRYFIFLGTLLAGGIFFQCQSVSPEGNADRLQKNLRLAQKNRAALEQVLQHYQKRPEDSLKLRAAVLLISNMEGNFYYDGEWLDRYNAIFNQTARLSEDAIGALKDSLLQQLGEQQLDYQRDLRNISKDYLIRNIDEAFVAWEGAPWRSKLDFDIFCNYILPYRNFNERPEDWRNSIRDQYQYLLKDSFNLTAEQVSCNLNNDLKKWFSYSENFNDYPGRISISNLRKGKRGNCSDMASLAAYSLRALGIPVAIDFTPQWGNYHDGHAWNALILNNHSSIPFLGAEVNPGEYSGLPEGESKPAKVFRRTLTIQENSTAQRAMRAGETKLPLYLQNPRLMDVTALYTLTYTVKIPIQKKQRNFVYACLYKHGVWEAIDGGTVDARGIATFRNLGGNILYNPMFYINGRYQSASAPFMVTPDGRLQMLTSAESATEKVHLTRVYTVKRSDAKWNFAKYLKDARLEAANKPDFSDAKTLLTITDPMKRWHVGQMGGVSVRDRLEYATLWETLPIKDRKPYRYVRLIFPEKQFCKIGELEIMGAGTTRLSGKPIGSVAHPAWAFDGVPGYSIIEESPEGGQWVGLDLGAAKNLEKLRYLPATGAHAVQPGKTYQLFYWKENWRTLSIQKANKHFVEFEAVPTQTLLWLHCKDCEKVLERPFTYENGKQIWW